ncbi:serine hydrolase [Tenacibaculum caenipelagi]|uniref:CubicO group peptidase (Beta-lactamase class C family) n=1 Tax=Tenacibaculum caenipelagi TaxID=1325435 RepID=A0A4R6TEZ1_9FLAO|nr:serine hydrolase [Tenacibaculum caenipelagi]TDQ23893.1 CubicO group peptidase (beta-lactamase class C family) [Tenacibaculum caenipelagi]
MKKVILFLSLITIVSLTNAVTAQEINSSEIDALVNRALTSTPSVGIAVAVVKDGKVIHSKGYGVKSVENKEKVDENTLFAIASNSKAFTAATLAILVDEGKLKWEDKVITYIPEFKMYNDYVTANFTILDLLTHRSGLGLGAGDLMFFPDGSNFTIKDVVSSFQYQKPVSAFRTKYDYDNLLYIVAGEVVARVSGMSWADFVQSRIFNPLGMKNSAPVSSKLSKNANLAFPHDSEGEKIKQLATYDNDLIAAAGGIYTSVHDLTQWMLVQLNNGKYGKELSNKLFSEKQQRQMWKPHTNLGFSTKPNPRTQQHFAAYGLGWFIADKQGKIVISHTGGLPGMLSKTVLVPELNLGIVVLTNSLPGGKAYSAIPETILDSYLKIEERDWVKILADQAKATGQKSDSVTTKVWKTVKKNKSSIINTNNYLGTYKDDWFGEVTISLKNEKLWFTSKRSPKLNGQMFYYKATTFAIKWEYTDMNADAFATFNLDEEGKAMGIKMKGISPNIDFSFDFQDLNLKRVEK